MARPPSPHRRRALPPLIAACFALFPVASAGAQVTSLPFDLVDVSDDPLAPDDCGVNFTYIPVDPQATMEAAGAAIADFDNDGLLDIFLPNTKNQPSRLYRNLGGFHFQDEAVARGVADPTYASADALFLDYDQDGDLDLWVVCHLGTSVVPLGPTPFKLFRNTGAAGGYTFVDVTSTAGFVLGATSKMTKYGVVSGVCAGDFNHDGWTDLFASFNSAVSAADQWRLLRNEPNPVPGDPNQPGYTPRIFVDATVGSGTEGEFGGNPWMPMFWDVNRDGWPDLHIAGDNTLDQMYINNKNGTFTNVATAVGLNGTPPEFRNEMGTALGDPDNDLDLDLHTTNVGNLDRFYRNDSFKGTLSFTDIAPTSGLNLSQVGWGTEFADLDNDGDQDHLNVTGIIHDTTKTYFNPVHLNLYPAMLPGNVGVAWANVAALLPDFSAMDTPAGDAAHGLAAGDLDNDGDVDFVVTRNLGQKAGVFKNTLVSSNGWLEVDLVGTAGSLATTGSRAYVKQGATVQMREIFTGSSFISQDAPRMHFGLGPPVYKRKLSGSTTGPGGSVGGLAGGAAGLPSAPGGGPASQGGLKEAEGPAWLVVRWPFGQCQVVMHPPRNARLVVQRSAVDDTGDLDADGHLTATDQALLQALILDPVGFAITYPDSPGVITGDVDFNGVVDADDLTAWSALPPH